MVNQNDDPIRLTQDNADFLCCCVRRWGQAITPTANLTERQIGVRSSIHTRA